MSGRGHNNPRTLGTTVSVDAWRRPFDGDTGLADLHIDVTFDTGRVGGIIDGQESPVRFRLSLRQAEVHVIRDALDVLDIPPETVTRPPPPSGRETKTTETTKSAEIGGRVSANMSAVDVGVEAKGKRAVEERHTLERTGDLSTIAFDTKRTDRGYAFHVAPKCGDRLKGRPWQADERCMRVRDPKAGRRRGDPPSVLIEIRCLREDLIIEDIELNDGSEMPMFWRERKKNIAVQQYLKDELAKLGLLYEDLANPYARIVLADVEPSEMQSVV